MRPLICQFYLTSQGATGFTWHAAGVRTSPGRCYSVQQEVKRVVRVGAAWPECERRGTGRLPVALSPQTFRRLKTVRRPL
ncbi:hypothetical protein R69919_01451 [Paraburkholderia gardini]|uniref:Uncharacterized protein n=1 Tax=Paraburkholderia gardini TaxID=2823469 RepID=A0ABM8TZH2_9BURK|nr:hypothetical protein R54767_00923 [Paraburkholderia gardini]CAG4892809.1 hypothetical protein R69919_01451 [Paraburkholderia gardini]